MARYSDKRCKRVGSERPMAAAESVMSAWHRSASPERAVAALMEPERNGRADVKAQVRVVRVDSHGG